MWKAWSAREEDVGRGFSVFDVRIATARHDVMEQRKHLTVTLCLQLEINATATRRQGNGNSFRVQMAQ